MLVCATACESLSQIWGSGFANEKLLKRSNRVCLHKRIHLKCSFHGTRHALSFFELAILSKLGTVWGMLCLSLRRTNMRPTDMGVEGCPGLSHGRRIPALAYNMIAMFT